MDSLLNFLTRGARLAHFAHESSAMIKSKTGDEHLRSNALKRGSADWELECQIQLLKLWFILVATDTQRERETSGQ